MKRFFLILSLVFAGMMAGSAQGVWPDSLNTAAATASMSQMERDVVFEINKLRSNPKRYVQEVVQPFLERFSENDMEYELSPGLWMRTQEGVKAVKECISVLKKTKPLPILHPDEILIKAAHAHTQDMARSGTFSHNSSDGTSFSDRIQQFGFDGTAWGENLAAGFENTAQDVVLQLVIDDGVPSRGHRKNLLSPDFNVVGIGCGEHPQWRTCCTMDFGRVAR